MYFPTSSATILETKSNTGDIVSLISLKNGKLFVSLTRDSITAWEAENMVILSQIYRPPESILSYGENQSIYAKEDAHILIIHTSTAYLLTYSYYETLESRVWKVHQSQGIPRLQLKFRQTIKIDAGISA